MNISILKVLGDIELSPRSIIVAVITLIFLGAMGNATYELLKLLPTLCFGCPLDWQNLKPHLPSLVLGTAWVSGGYLWWRWKQRRRQLKGYSPPPFVAPHRGIVLALSVPTEFVDGKPQKIEPNEIKSQVTATDNHNPEELFKIRGIGQLFKAIYNHRSAPLEHVWLLTTDVSRAYVPCMKAFLDRFVSGAKLQDQDLCNLLAADDQAMIAEVKGKLDEIYSPQNLKRLVLQMKDVIVELSGGTKTITIGMLMGALDSDIDLQYVEQMTIKHDVIPLELSLEQILDKAAAYLLELYEKLAERRRECK